MARHARSRRGRVTLLQSGDALELVVQDWGVGFEPSRAGTSSMGLLSMRERAQLMGGTFSVDSEPGRGTRVSVAVPIKPSGAARERP